MENITLPETNSSHPEMGGWNTIVAFWDGQFSRVKMLVLGSAWKYPDPYIKYKNLSENGTVGSNITYPHLPAGNLMIWICLKRSKKLS